MKFHVNNQGVANLCKAKAKCPFGGVENRFPTKKDAMTAYEAKMNKSEGTFKFFKKKDFIQPADYVKATARSVITTINHPNDRVTVDEAIEDIAFRKMAEENDRRLDHPRGDRSPKVVHCGTVQVDGRVSKIRERSAPDLTELRIDDDSLSHHL